MKRNKEWWQEELAYCQDMITGQFNLGSFNHDWLCFSRYCKMQGDLCSKDGFADITDVIYAIGNRAARNDKSQTQK
jgi:hypothetical protein